MNIYEIRTCQFNSIDKYGNIGRLIYNDSQKQLCIMDLETRIATDIFTQEQFYVLKRDKTNRIAAEESDKIIFNQKYGVDAKPYDMDNLSLADYYKTSFAYLKTICKKTKGGRQKIKG